MSDANTRAETLDDAPRGTDVRPRGGRTKYTGRVLQRTVTDRWTYEEGFSSGLGPMS